MAFLGAELRPGFELFARQAALERRLRAADLVVTGEGAIDRSTLMGKGVGQIARRCRELNIPCIGLAGMVSAERGEAAELLRPGPRADGTDHRPSKPKRNRRAGWSAWLASCGSERRLESSSSAIGLELRRSAG